MPLIIRTLIRIFNYTMLRMTHYTVYLYISDVFLLICDTRHLFSKVFQCTLAYLFNIKYIIAPLLYISAFLLYMWVHLNLIAKK